MGQRASMGQESSDGLKTGTLGRSRTSSQKEKFLNGREMAVKMSTSPWTGDFPPARGLNVSLLRGRTDRAEEIVVDGHE